jgi:hypothetical protein
MTYAIIQAGLEPPSMEQLRTAFAQVPGLTALDVNILGRDAFGILAKGLGGEQAEAMRSALAAVGFEAEAVEDVALPELPPPVKLGKVTLTPAAFVTDNLMGRVTSLEWKSIAVIAAGRARLTDFTKELVNKVVAVPAGRHVELKVVTEAVTKEEKKDHLLLEIITTGAAARYHIVADRPEALLLFQSLGAQRTKDSFQNLNLFVRELVKFAPSAVLNHGAHYMCEGINAPFCYPSQTAFYRESSWLLWMIASGRAE